MVETFGGYCRRIPDKIAPHELVFSVYGGEHNLQNINFEGKEETDMENEKKIYEAPEVTKVEFDAGERITASICTFSTGSCNLSP